MPFDLRLPLGLLFGLYGLILTGTGLLGGPELAQVSLGLNMNLWWGMALLVFAMGMLVSWKFQRRK